MAFEVPDVIPEPLQVNKQEEPPDVQYGGGRSASFFGESGFPEMNAFPEMNDFFFNSPAPSPQ